MPFNVFLQYILPQHLLTKIVRTLANCRWKWFKNWSIKRLIRKYNVNLSEAISIDLDYYPTFNSFFTRQLKPGIRPLAPSENQIVSPVDGEISQIGNIKSTQIFQAKNFYYNLSTLLGNQEKWVKIFQNGKFATLYLAPGDYHRVHMPCTATLQQTIYVPGKLFSVNPTTVNHVPNLFTRNERLISIFESEIGPLAIILVGAMLVGQMQTVWSEKINEKPLQVITPAKNYTIKKGNEMGRFLMGSTVILLHANINLHWNKELHKNKKILLGQSIASIF